MRRLIYLGYYLKNLDYKMFKKFLNYTGKSINRGKFVLLWDVLKSSLIYNISLLEYFQFKFYNLEKADRKTFAGTGYMYEYQLVMNPRKSRDILDDKTKFYKLYRSIIKHKIADLKDLRKSPSLEDTILNNPSAKVVLKIYNGQCGNHVLIKDSKDFGNESLNAFMNKQNFDLVEEYIIQHKLLSELSPTAVNTVRIYSQLNSLDEFEILGCRLRISVNSIVDNMAAGNLAAPVNEKTGIVNGPGVYSDITKSPEDYHPVTGVSIVGFKIPFWQETINLVREASLMYPQNRSVGWDIAITENGPDLIEGNHDWCKLVWQLPVNKGLKPILEKHLFEYKSIQKNI